MARERPNFRRCRDHRLTRNRVRFEDFRVFFGDQWGSCKREKVLYFDKANNSFHYSPQGSRRVLVIDIADVELILFNGETFTRKDYKSFIDSFTTYVYMQRHFAEGVRRNPAQQASYRSRNTFVGLGVASLITIAVLLMMATATDAIVGYDCSGATFNVTTISLKEVAECELPPEDPKPSEVYVQLLQLSEFDNTEVMQCKIEITRIIHHCGMHSHNSIVHDGLREYIQEIDKATCQRIQETGIIRLGYSAEVVGLRKNETTMRSLTLAGSTTMDGECSGTQYSDPFGTWNDVVVHATVKITLSTHHATVNLRAGKIILVSGTQCELSEGHCLDIEGNSAFWSVAPVDTCNFKMYDVLYEGVVTKFTTKDNNTRSPDVYSLISDSTTFALAKRAEHHLCGYLLMTTEHPKLFILETRKGESFTSNKKISVNNLDIFTYMNSKFIYVEKHVRKQMTSLYKDVLTQRCNMERQILQNALSTAALLPEKFAYTVMRGPGHMSVIAGEVAHIIKCTPVECKLRRTEECYQELPVTYRNESYYLSPTTRTLVRSATLINCDPIIPAQYQIEGTWYRFSPQPVEVMAPRALEPMTKPTWRYRSAGNLANSGIYTEEDVNKLRERIMFPAEKPALLNNIARGSAGYSLPPGSVSIKGLLDEETLNHLAENAATRLWNGFIKFGSASAGIIGVFLTLRAIKFVIDTCIQGYAIHSLYGWSLHLLGAIWSSVTGLLLTLGQKRTEVTRADVESGRENQHPIQAPPPRETTPADVESGPEKQLPVPARRAYPLLPQKIPPLKSTSLKMEHLDGVDPELSARLAASRTQSHDTASR